MKIEFKDQSMIESWTQQSDELTQESNNEMIATSNLVAEIKGESDGTLVDELVTISNRVLNTAKELTGTMSEISETIKNVTSKVADFVDDVGGFLKNIAGGLLG